MAAQIRVAYLITGFMSANFEQMADVRAVYSVGDFDGRPPRFPVRTLLDALLECGSPGPGWGASACAWVEPSVDRLELDRPIGH